MSRNIIIIGGGISGLSALHYLHKKFSAIPGVSARLFEKEEFPGGTVRTHRREGCQYETGPNGFLDSKSSTLELAHELGLEGELIAANSATKIRYICVDNRLYSLPAKPGDFFAFPLLTFSQKLRVLKEIIIAKGTDKNETVYEFGTRRLGEKFAELFLAPMVSGIFGGDARELNLKFAFPRIHEIEQTYGSLFKGMIALGVAKRKKKNFLPAGQPAGQLWSFKKGMGQLAETLAQKYSNFISYNTVVTAIIPNANGFKVDVGKKSYFADDVVLSVPAYAAAQMVSDFDLELSALLKRIEYASIAVVGLTYLAQQFVSNTKGFGYLRVFQEGNEVLGTLFSNQIYSERCPDGKKLFQVMLGGSQNPATCARKDTELFSLAENEIKSQLSGNGAPVDRFLVRWQKGIPQYNRSYPQIYEAIKNRMTGYPHLHLLANYLDGISLNDCTANAKKLAGSII